MDIHEPKGVYTHEYIMQWDTDGVDEWNATRKEKLVRCRNCMKYKQANDGSPFGYCKGFRKWDTGYCDEAIALPEENTDG